MRRWMSLIALAALLLPSTASAQSPTPSAHGIIARMLERNPSLASYRSRVHIDVRKTNFPFINLGLDGTSYYKKPNNFELVFDSVPSYAKGFEKIFTDVGDPGSWEKDHDITFDGMKTLYGRSYISLRLTKKIYSTITDHAEAYIDPQNYEVIQMEWYYRSGGMITMRQWYRSDGNYSVISQQHAEINIPHIRAVADSKYGPYQTNVAVDDSVFTKK